MSPLLQVRSLDLVLDPARRRLHVLRGIDLELRPAEILGVIGESGSGKTMLGLSLLRLEPPAAALSATAMQLAGANLLQATPATMQTLRGRIVGMVFQDPVGAFNPAKRIAWHARAVLHRPFSRWREKVGMRVGANRPNLGRLADPHPNPLPQAGEGADWRQAATAMLANVDIADAPRVLAAYPHQLSGGMLQRVLIALVLAARPALVIADEPTTNLDNIVEQQILALFRRFREQDGAAFILITHDMSVAAVLCDRIAVMYAGELVETGPAATIFAAPRHPYTQALIATAQALGGDARRLPELPGEPPALAAPRPGCAFASRCPHRMDACTAAPIPMFGRPGAQARCLLHAHA